MAGGALQNGGSGFPGVPAFGGQQGAPGAVQTGGAGGGAPVGAPVANNGPIPDGQGLVRPLDNYRITQEFGQTEYARGRYANNTHTGIDLAATAGTPIRAAKAGRVVRVASDQGGYGNWVEIQHADGSTTRYAHMSGFAAQQGQNVQAGQVIGYVGSTGNSTGPHLHFEYRVNGRAVDPRQLMQF
ncbi:MAG: M23 family metallopeptidase [Armatimonadetes bacterium]|nr:M23 family metallopeptidase [Armatimonadota bacterium]